MSLRIDSLQKVGYMTRGAHKDAPKFSQYFPQGRDILDFEPSLNESGHWLTDRDVICLSQIHHQVNQGCIERQGVLVVVDVVKSHATID